MVTQKELACIEEAQAMKRQVAQRQLSDLQQRNIRFEKLIEGSGIWHSVCGMTWKQRTLLPVVLAILPLMYLLTTIVYVMEWWSFFQERRQLRKKIAALGLLQAAPDWTPEQKTLRNLWRAYGPSREDGYSCQEKLMLLREWIEILYSSEVLAAA